MNNTDNDLWNLRHYGSRVPVNDTGVPGAPFGLAKTSKSWNNGSVNKAIYDTWIINEREFEAETQEDALYGRLSLLLAAKYAEPSMLYGVNEDSRGKLPRDLMAFRGYPTATISSNITLEESTTPFGTLITGVQSGEGSFTTIKYDVNLPLKLPYAVEFEVEFLVNGSSVLDGYFYKIEAGNTNVSHYRIYPDTAWSELAPTKGIYHSIDNSALTGNLVISGIVVNVVQTPFYGALQVNELTIPEASYSPAEFALASSIGINALFADSRFDSSLGLGLSNYLSRVEKCNEFTNSDIYPRTQKSHRFYLKNTDELVVGSKLWADELAITPAIEENEAGGFMWIESSYYNFDLGTIWAISMYLVLDHNSTITFIDYPEEGYLGIGCRIDL